MNRKFLCLFFLFVISYFSFAEVHDEYSVIYFDTPYTIQRRFDIEKNVSQWFLYNKYGRLVDEFFNADVDSIFQFRNEHETVKNQARFPPPKDLV